MSKNEGINMECIHHVTGSFSDCKGTDSVESLFLSGMSNINNVRFRRNRIYCKKLKRDETLQRIHSVSRKNYLSIVDTANMLYYFYNSHLQQSLLLLGYLRLSTRQ